MVVLEANLCFNVPSKQNNDLKPALFFFIIKFKKHLNVSKKAKSEEKNRGENNFPQH